MKSELPALLHAMQPGRNQQRLALIVAALLLAGLVLAAPFASVRYTRIDAFIPVADTIILVTDTLTAVFLYSTFVIRGTRALLALACGYLFTALLIIPHALTFPGAFAPHGLLGAGVQTNAYLFIFWHLGLPVSAIAYGLLAARNPARVQEEAAIPGRAVRRVLGSIGVVVLLVAAFTWLSLHADRLLPSLMIDGVRSNGSWIRIAPFILLLEAGAMWVVWRGRVTIIDMWLLVALWAWFIEILLLTTTIYRFSLVWYAGRIYGFLAGSFVLAALVAQSTTLYTRLVVSVLAQRRERETRFHSVDTALSLVAHEIRQPLSAMILNGSACLFELSKDEPQLGELKPILADIVADGRRVSDVITSLRATLKQGQRARDQLDLGDIVVEIVTLLGAELRHRKVSVEMDLDPDVPQVYASRTQLKQVLVNLITNAIEAMEGVGGGRLFVRTRLAPEGVVVEIEDRGPGIDVGNAQLIFDTFFTTKMKGTGLGLSVCRMIVEDHGGRLSTAPAHPHGAIFRFSLPASQAA